MDNVSDMILITQLQVKDEQQVLPLGQEQINSSVFVNASMQNVSKRVNRNGNKMVNAWKNEDAFVEDKIIIIESCSVE